MYKKQIGAGFVSIAVGIIIARVVGLEGLMFAFIMGGLGLLFIISGIKKIKMNRSTKLNGERCFGKILNCDLVNPTDTEYEVTVSIYVPSMRKRTICREEVGKNNFKYPINTYLEVLYYNNDINVVRNVRADEIPSNILEVLNDGAVQEELNEYNNNTYAEADIREGEIIDKVEAIQQTAGKISLIIQTMSFFAFSILSIIFTGYIFDMFEMFSDFSGNFPWSLVFPLVLMINLGAIYPMIKNPINSKERVVCGLLFFATLVFIMAHDFFIN